MKLYVAATRQNDGKTIVSLGLLRAFEKAGKSIGYMKPVGQSFRIINGVKVDKDVVLMQKFFGLPESLEDMSPIAVPHGFTEKYILDGNKEELQKRVLDASNAISSGRDFFLFEGTGHAGVGSVFDMSNSDVARLVGAKVIIVSIGGIGRPIDQIMLNKAEFDRMNVEVVGAIINKVVPEKHEKINKIVRKGLERKGIRCLGVIPQDDVLSNPSVRELFEDLNGEVLSGDGDALHMPVARFIIGVMRPHDALGLTYPNTLLICPGNREELILAVLSDYILGKSESPRITGIIFTLGIRPHPRIMDLLMRTNIPLLLVEGDSFNVATQINNLIFKLQPDDTEKMKRVERMISDYVDVDVIADLLS